MKSRAWDVWKEKVRPLLTAEMLWPLEVELARKGSRKWRGPCPIHGGDNDQALSVYPDRLEFKCFSCDAKGGPIEWWAAWKNRCWPITPEQRDVARDELAQLVGVDLAAVVSKPVPLDGEALRLAWKSWHERRALDRETIDLWGGKLVGRRKRPALVYPSPCSVDRVRYLDEGKPKTDWVTETGQGEPCWYGLDEALSILELGARLYLVNGEPSVWACYQSGVPAICTCFGETTVPGPARLAELATAARQVGASCVVVYDSDGPGRRGAWAMIEALQGVGLEAVALALPDDLGEKADVDDLHRRVGDAGLEVALAALPPLPKEGVEQVTHWLPDAPVPAGSMVPEDWRLSLGGVECEKSVGRAGDVELEIVARSPVVIVSRLEDRLDRSEHLELAWRADGRWKNQVLPRQDCADARLLVRHAREGLPVTSMRAGRLANYLSDYEELNRPRIPQQVISSQLGWQGDEGFLLGELYLAPPSVGQARSIRFHSDDAGQLESAGGYHAEGTIEGWMRAVEPLKSYPRALLGLYASFVPPLLQVLHVPNFIVDWSYMTSHGKTIVLRVAGSAWGCPREEEHGSVVKSWDRTRVAIERSAAMLSGLPYILDDTKKATKPQDIGQAVYTISQGQGRGRGSVTGMQATGHWRTVLLSCGEQPITSFTADGGTRARVVSIWGSPFSGVTAETARVVDHVNAGVASHYGHAGPKFIAWMLANRASWPAWQEEYGNIRATYLERSEGNGVLGRISSYLAAITCTAWLVHLALELPFPRQDVVATLWGGIAEESESADRATLAYRFVVDWARSHPADFVSNEMVSSDDNRQPSQGWAGKRVKGAIYWFASRLERILDDAGFEPTSIVRTWKDRGMLDVDTDQANRNCKRVRIGGERLWVYALNVEEDKKEPENIAWPARQPEMFA